MLCAFLETSSVLHVMSLIREAFRWACKYDEGNSSNSGEKGHCLLCLRDGFRVGPVGPWAPGPHGIPPIQFKLINCKKVAPRMHRNSPFWAQKSKNFLRRGHSPLPRPLTRGEWDTPSCGRGTSPPHTRPPQRLWRLYPRAYGAWPRPQGWLPKIRAHLVLPPPKWTMTGTPMVAELIKRPLKRCMKAILSL